MFPNKSKSYFFLAVFALILLPSLFYFKGRNSDSKNIITYKNEIPDPLDNLVSEDHYKELKNSKIPDNLESEDLYKKLKKLKIPDNLESEDHYKELNDSKVPDNLESEDHYKELKDSKVVNNLKDTLDSLETILKSLKKYVSNSQDDKNSTDSLKNDTDNTLVVDKNLSDTIKNNKNLSDTIKNNNTYKGEEEPYFKECMNIINEKIKNKKYKEAVVGLSNYLVLEPLAKINETCHPPPVEENVKCENYKSAFGNKPRPANNKIGILIQFGFDIEILEVYLNEVYDLVDKFFIVESVITHSAGQYRKPLIWERVKDSDRFAKFSDKIVHFVIDNSDLKNKTEKWVSERNQEKLRWEKFLKWNEENDFFGEDDIIGFGDADEIPSRKALNILKSCTGDFVSIDIGSVFIYGSYNTVVRSDWPIPGYPYSLGDPSFFTLKSAKEYSKKSTPNRRRGTSGKYLVGGMGIHLTYYSYLPFLVNKYLVCSESSKLFVNTTKSMSEITFDIINLSKAGHKWRDYKDVKSQVKDIYYIPWFLKCNPDRFPTFYNKPDPREYLPKSKIDFEC